MAFPSAPYVGQPWTEYGKSWVFDGNGWAPPTTATSLRMVYPVRTMAELGDPAVQQNYVYRCTDAPGGETIVYSDGTNWLRQYDSSPVNS